MSTIFTDTQVAELAAEASKYLGPIANVFADLANGTPGHTLTAELAGETARDLNSLSQFLLLIAARERGEIDTSAVVGGCVWKQGAEA